MRTSKIARIAIALLPFSLWSALREGKRLANRLGTSTQNTSGSLPAAELSYLSYAAAMKDDKNRLQSSIESSSANIQAVPSNSYNAPVKRDDGDDKPLFILHIGPPKTGTTSLQYFAGDHQDILQQDNIHYLGQYKPRKDMRIHDLCFSCLMEKESVCQDKWRELERKVDYQYNQKHTVFMSEENFILQDAEGDSAEHLWRHLEPMLSKWHVRIILTYRRYYEWLPSWYYQYHNPNGERGRTKKRFLLWPDGKRRMIPTFRAFFQQHVDNDFSLVSEIRLWRSKFPDVKVLNMHNEQETVRQLFCNAIPEAKQLCTVASKKKQFQTKNSSAKKYVHFDRIAMGAYQEGFVKDGLNRTEVKVAVEVHSRELGLIEVTDFPYLCLNKNQSEVFLNLSLELEAELLPELHSTAEGGEKLKADYAEAAKKGTFCSVDVKAMLKEKQWQQFFETLGSETTA